MVRADIRHYRCSCIDDPQNVALVSRDHEKVAIRHEPEVRWLPGHIHAAEPHPTRRSLRTTAYPHATEAPSTNPSPLAMFIGSAAMTLSTRLPARHFRTDLFRHWRLQLDTVTGPGGRRAYAFEVDAHLFPLLDEVVAPTDTQPPGAHVVDFEIQKLLSRGWQRYVATVREAAGDDHGVAVRQITTSFEGECHGGDTLVLGVRALHRTRRSYVLEEALWEATTDRIVATSRVVMASVDAEMGRAAPIPTALWDAIESFEGRTLETVESSPRPI